MNVLREAAVSLRRAMTVATVRAFLLSLRGRLTQYDARLQAKQPNNYRLALFFKAVEKVEREVARYLDDDSPEAMAALKRSLAKNFTPEGMGPRFSLSPVNAIVRAIDAWVKDGIYPKYS